jgi:hypothetical protein
MEMEYDTRTKSTAHVCYLAPRGHGSMCGKPSDPDADDNDVAAEAGLSGRVVE